MRTCFCTFQEQSSCFDTRRTNVLSLMFYLSGRQVVQFLRIFWKTKVDLSNKIIPRLLTHHELSLSEI